MKTRKKNEDLSSIQPQAGATRNPPNSKPDQSDSESTTETRNKSTVTRSRSPNMREDPPKCSLCNGFGHIESKCWFKHPSLAPPGWTSRTKERLQKSTQSKDEDLDSLEPYAGATRILSSSSSTSQNDWMIDSCASHHMTGNRGAFASYKPLNPNIPVNSTYGHRGGSTPGFNKHLTFSSPDGREFRAELADNDVFQLRSCVAASTTESKTSPMVLLGSTPVSDLRTKKRRGRPPNNRDKVKKTTIKKNSISNTASDVLGYFSETDDPGIGNSKENWIRPTKHHEDEAQSRGEDPQTIANKAKELRTVLDTIGLD
ncbi:hypothetical protein V8E54_006493 [Elaphomyces granulatus]